MQNGGGQTAASNFGNRRKAEMPGFGPDPRQYTAKRAEKSEPGRVRLQPLGERCEGPGRCELLLREPYPVARRGGLAIDEIDVRAPVMSARSGQSGPEQNHLHALQGGQLAHVDGAARYVERRLLAKEFSVPDRQLTRKVSKAADGYRIEAISQGR